MFKVEYSQDSLGLTASQVDMMEKESAIDELDNNDIEEVESIIARLMPCEMGDCCPGPHGDHQIVINVPPARGDKLIDLPNEISFELDLDVVNNDYYVGVHAV